MSSNRIGQTVERCRLMAAWQEAYGLVNKRPAPGIEYRNGWFKIEGTLSGYRRADILRMTENLRARAAQ